MFKQLFLTSFLIITGYANVLLVAKNENFLMRNLLNTEFLDEHNVEKLANFKDFNIYTSTEENYNTFQNTFDSYFTSKY